MRRTLRLFVLACACGVLAIAATNLTAAAQRQTPPTGNHPCSLLTAAEIEKAVGGKDPLDDRPPREEPWKLPSGQSGAECSFSVVTFQVDPYPWGTFEANAKSEGSKPLAGVGDAAYMTVKTSAPAMVGVAARAGQHTLTVRVDLGRSPTQTEEKARSAAIALAQAIIAKLH